MKETPYRENAACPVDHGDIERAAFQKGVDEGRRLAEKAAVKAWWMKFMDTDTPRVIMILGTITMLGLLIVRCIIQWVPTDKPRCQEFKADTVNAVCVEGHLVSEGNQLICRCPGKQ